MHAFEKMKCREVRAPLGPHWSLEGRQVKCDMDPAVSTGAATPMTAQGAHGAGPTHSLPVAKCSQTESRARRARPPPLRHQLYSTERRVRIGVGVEVKGKMHAFELGIWHLSGFFGAT